MKRRVMVARTLILTLNVCLAVWLLLFLPALATVDQKVHSRAIAALRDSGAVDMDALDKYVVGSRAWDGDGPKKPIDCLEWKNGYTGEIWRLAVFPSGLCLLLNILVMFLFWPRQDKNRSPVVDHTISQKT